MMRALIIIGSFLLSLGAMALNDRDLLENLRGRMRPLGLHRGSLIKSYTHLNQSYIYDQALAIIAFTQAKRRKEARSLLQSLARLQRPDGSLYFSYFLDGSSPYPIEGDRRIAGAIAWVALSASHYQHKFKSKEFFTFNLKLLTYLQKEMKTVSIDGNLYRTLRFGPVDIKETPFREDQITALEHNLDAYAAFSAFADINHDPSWASDIQDIKNFIFSLWDKKNSHFWSGASLADGLINKNEFYLDNQSWTILALDPKDLEAIRPEKALLMNCQKLFVHHQGVFGFMDVSPARSPAAHAYVWSEGTLGQIMAMNKIQRHNSPRMSCHELTTSELLSSVMKMKKEDGGIAYSTTSEKADFTTSSSVAGTAWLFFAVNNFNPFKLSSPN
jgi:hypothetical protein